MPPAVGSPPKALSTPAPVSSPPTVAPAPVSAPQPAPESKPPPETGGDNPFAELETAWKEVETKPADKPTDKPADKPVDKAPAKPVETPTDKPKPFNAPKEMRDHISKLEGDIKTRDTEMGKLKSKLGELETKAKEHGTLSERITALEKERDDAMSQVRALKQEASPEFIKQYDKPFNDAATYAKSIVEELSVVEGEASRPAKWDDFAALYALPPGKANKAARDMFADDAQTVINHLQELHRLDYNRKQALTEERDNAKKRMTEEESKAVQQREQIQEMWTRVNKDLVESVEDYHDTPEDTESAEVRSKALAIYDAQPRTMKEKIVKDAHIRQRIGHYSVLKRQFQLVKGELAEAKKELESFKHPQPGKGKRSAPAGTPEKDWEEDLRDSVTA